MEQLDVACRSREEGDRHAECQEGRNREQPSGEAPPAAPWSTDRAG